MTKLVLLTGGFGNIGGRFSSYIANSTDYQIRLSSRQQQVAPRWAGSASVVTCDLRQPESLDAATIGVDTIFHFASLNDRECAADPHSAHSVNVIGTENLISSAIRNNVKRIIYMSTIHVYGSPLVGQISEDCLAKPTHPYGLTHLNAEVLLTAASASIQSIIVRCGNGFGYPMSPDVNIWHVIVNDLCTQAIVQQTMTLKSPSNIERNFITLADVCRALLHIDNDALGLENSSTFNLGSKESRTLRQMADLIALRCKERFGMTVKIVESVPRTTSETSLDFDTSRIRQTGFTTTEDFVTEIDGILDMLNANNNA